jgi:hypothetical protein
VKVIERNKLEVDRWDQLVLSSSNHTLFSLSTYLDSVAENWAVLVNEDYTSGIALPYTIRFGVKILYTPFFMRYIEVLGGSGIDKLEIYLKSNFESSKFKIRTKLLLDNSNVLTFQEVRFLKMNQQVKRMLVKSSKSDFEIKEVKDGFDEVLKLIENELSSKVEVFQSDSKKYIERLVENLKFKSLIKIYGFYQLDELVGGMIFILAQNRTIYLKGAANDKARNQGLMYACMKNEIENTLQEGKIFDFGGSSIEGVKRFNLNFGSDDIEYYEYEWNHAPWWWRLLKYIRKKIMN